MAVNNIDMNNDIHRLHKLLIMGVEGGTYFAGEKPLIRENVDCISRLIGDNHVEELVNEILRYNQEELSVKEKPVIFALALCARDTNKKAKSAAYKSLQHICRDSIQLFTFVDFCETLSGKSSGWGRGHRKAISDWYNSFAPNDLARLITKNIKYGGWSHIDVLRLAHVKPKNNAIGIVLKYAAKGYMALKKDLEIDGLSDEHGELVKLLEAIYTVKHSHDDHQVARLIEEHHLSIEYVPTWMSRSKEVWGALLNDMPLRVILRLLGRMSSIGLLEPGNNASKTVISRLEEERALELEKLRPFDLLIAMKTYESGKGEKGKIKWTPNCNVLNAVTKAFYNSFKHLEPLNKRFLIAVDVSGSMAYGSVNGSPSLSPAVTTAALAMSIARTEKECEMVAFSTGITTVPLNPQMDLVEVCKQIADVPTGGTDCALPILWAMEKKKPVDVFLILTDCETLSVQIHPAQALQQYRQIMGIQDSKFIICALTSGGFTIADPTDPAMLDIAGFDAGAERVIRSFVQGKL